MDLETDRGRLNLLLHNIHEHIQYTKYNSIIITDMEGKRCEIRDISKLDKHSLKEWNRVI